MEEYLAAPEVAELLQLSEKTVCRLAQGGDLPGSTAGGSWRVRRREQNHVLYPDDGRVFPSTDMKGRVSHVAQPKEHRYDDLGRKVGHVGYIAVLDTGFR